MKVTKFAHCTMLIEVAGKTILTDPGVWSDLEIQSLPTIDIIFITHEHSDHLHLDGLKSLLIHSPRAQIITNGGVGLLLAQENISYEMVKGGESHVFAGINISTTGKRHAEIYQEFGIVENTGFILDNKFFFPGDAFDLPSQKIELLALPVVGPWLNLRQCIDFAKAVSPKIAFPVHDGMLKHTGPFHKVPKLILEPEGMEIRLPAEEATKIIVEL